MFESYGHQQRSLKSLDVFKFERSIAIVCAVYCRKYLYMSSLFVAGDGPHLASRRRFIMEFERRKMGDDR